MVIGGTRENMWGYETVCFILDPGAPLHYLNGMPTGYAQSGYPVCE
jgi:hypothetical protein